MFRQPPAGTANVSQSLLGHCNLGASVDTHPLGLIDPTFNAGNAIRQQFGVEGQEIAADLKPDKQQ